MTLRKSEPKKLSALADGMVLEPDSRQVLEKNRDLLISGLADLDKAGPDSLVFVGSVTYVRQVETSKAKVFVIDRRLRERVDAFAATSKVFLFVNDSKLALAKLSRVFDLETKPLANIDPLAKVHSSVQLGSGVAIGAFAEVGEGTVLEDGVIIDSGVKIGAGVFIGAATRIFPNVVIYDRVQIGMNCRVHANSVIGGDGFGYAQERIDRGVVHQKLYHLGAVRIADDVEIGAGTTIDRGTLSDTIIGTGTKIDNQVQIGHNCQIGKGVIICGKTGLSGSATVGDFVVIAGLCGVANGAEIGTGAVIAGMSGVQGTVAAGMTMAGNPARPKNDFFRIQGALGALPEMLKAFRKSTKGSSREENA
jgi:UDP-3-O-[3-hydroxymyristoyl] glucosamine N-acyltransferase